MAKTKKAATKALDKVLDDLDENISDLEPDELSAVIKGHTQEAFELRRTRKAVRYRLSRIQTMVLGGCDSEDVDGLQERFEVIAGFAEERDGTVIYP